MRAQMSLTAAPTAGSPPWRPFPGGLTTGSPKRSTAGHKPNGDCRTRSPEPPAKTGEAEHPPRRDPARRMPPMGLASSQTVTQAAREPPF